MIQNKQKEVKSPDLSKMQAVIIDTKTTIYIPVESDPEEARMRYLERRQGPRK
ncbi:hypothetical protein [Alkaliflexus imshenetskii]|jgi:hypothetical protein|uniref:hypothetical protein n=1 Tax=Alkaliflexus imshenetskii TaxID=286730 RepID=UPI0004B4CBB6|nr:hypothetical protein [Alkaliflexus imshenetskii]